jgi:hypothetical protein
VIALQEWFQAILSTSRKGSCGWVSGFFPCKKVWRTLRYGVRHTFLQIAGE